MKMPFAIILTSMFLACSVQAVSFTSARPVWPEGREKEMNLSVGFRAAVDGAAANNASIRLTGSTVYRIFVNNKFLGYGPARGPHGFYRVDEWPLKGRCRPGANVIAIEVAGYNVNSYYHLDQPSFLQAEIVDGGKVIASTAGDGTSFEAKILESRVQKTQRYSFQRTFSEVYRLTPQADGWRGGGSFSPVKLAEMPAVRLLDRIAPYPDFKVRPPAAELFRGTVKHNPDAKISADRVLSGIGPKYKGYPQKELTTVPMHEVQKMETVTRAASGSNYNHKQKLRIADNEFRIFDFGLNNAGFFGAVLRSEAPARVYFVFDEILSGEDVSIRRYSCANVVAYDLAGAGTYRVETFEPYQLKVLKVIVSGGPCEISGLHFREYVNPDAGRAVFTSSDPDLNRIFEAARETFKQNAVDVFSDCAGRERAGWLCDSFFTSRVAADLCGNNDMERMFFQNYLLPEKFAHLPEGMLPMCYPSDHYNGNYIPNWAMWFVVQLEEYLQRSGDRAMIDALKPRMLALLKFFEKYRNSDGLLEKLPAWVFVEWSHANKLVQDVNYPSNMTYAEVLDCVARLYDLPGLARKAEQMRETIRKQSFDGTFFVDNAVRQPDGSLKLSGERTETCQYYAFFFHAATPETHAALWKTLRDDFGPDRKKTGKYPEIHFANAFIGNYLRLELLSRQHLSAQILNETKGYFLNMTDLTGTLWENDTPRASCSHGFASHVARMYYRDVLGVRSIDPVNKRIALTFPDVPLNHCKGVIPVKNDSLALSWRKHDNKLTYSLKAPEGYEVTADCSRLSIPAIRE
ncbi:MAG: hypothetical protein PHG96_02290 [Kiritimatiellae bacterium]|nr:hypothetical protein [Kiritimatiellia bacterium]MDD3544172.1 hypothetical protein [Kiritimatiellia bacterium]MDD4024958.1 hypothetical protein [Kiritimatiellia bacterium]